MIGRIRSGGQSGVDLAALVVATELGIPTEGWMPRGFLTEDGPRPEYAAKYGLRETESTSYPERTRFNIDEADATMILVDGPPLTGGTKLTRDICQRNDRALLIEYLDCPEEPITPAVVRAVRHWLHSVHKGHVINVAGPRESKCPGIYARAVAFLRLVLTPEKGR